MRPHKTKAEYVSEFFGKNSVAKRTYNKFASSEFIDVPWYNGVDRWQEINENLNEIAVLAILENKIAWLNLTLSKLYAGWAEVIPFFSMKRNLGPNSYLKIATQTNWFEVSRLMLGGLMVLRDTG